MPIASPLLTGSSSLFLSEWSDRYNNLKTACDSLMEAANHAGPQALGVALTVVLERLKRDEFKRKGPDSKN